VFHLRTEVIEQLSQGVQSNIQEKANKLFWMLNQLEITASKIPAHMVGKTTTEIVEMNYEGDQPILHSNIKSDYWKDHFKSLLDVQKANYIWTLQNIYNDRVEDAYLGIIRFVEGNGNMDGKITEDENRALSILTTHFLFPSVTEREAF
jgi:hypothetical protein